MMKYIGGGRWMPGIPARDLTEEEAKEYGGIKALEKTGLYTRVSKKEVEKDEKEGEAWQE
jgi:hypothetical protein